MEYRAWSWDEHSQAGVIDAAVRVIMDGAVDVIIDAKDDDVGDLWSQDGAMSEKDEGGTPPGPSSGGSLVVEGAKSVIQTDPNNKGTILHYLYKWKSLEKPKPRKEKGGGVGG